MNIYEIEFNLCLHKFKEEYKKNKRLERRVNVSDDKLIQIVNELGVNNVIKLRNKIEQMKKNNDFSKLKKIMEVD